MRLTLWTAVFGAVTAAALGFGATQALASPAQTARRACDLESCNAYCATIPCTGGGRCAGGSCLCFYYACDS